MVYDDESVPIRDVFSPIGQLAVELSVTVRKPVFSGDRNEADYFWLTLMEE